MSYDNSLQEGSMDSERPESATAWTKTQPEDEGYYWWRMDTDGDADPCHVKDGRVWDFGEPDSLPLNGLGGEWLGPISPSDAEQLIELRKLAAEARDVLALLVPYGKIHTVEGVRYPDGSHSEAVDRGERVLNQLRAVLNPSHS